MSQNKALQNLLYIKEIIFGTDIGIALLHLQICSWIFAVNWNNLFKITLKRGTSIVFSVHSLSSLKMILDDWEKDYTCLMFNNLRKLTKILTRTNSMQHILFHFRRNMGDIKIFSLHKKAGSILKNCLEIDLWGKKEHFAKHLIVCKFFWDSLVQNLLNFLEL